MPSPLEKDIRKLKKAEFGPDDPRTSSLNSDPGDPGSLSLENLRKLLEHSLAQQEWDEFLRQASPEELKRAGTLLRQVLGK